MKVLSFKALWKNTQFKFWNELSLKFLVTFYFLLVYVGNIVSLSSGKLFQPYFRSSFKHWTGSEMSFEVLGCFVERTFTPGENRLELRWNDHKVFFFQKVLLTLFDAGQLEFDIDRNGSSRTSSDEANVRNPNSVEAVWGLSNRDTIFWKISINKAGTKLSHYEFNSYTWLFQNCSVSKVRIVLSQLRIKFFLCLWIFSLFFRFIKIGTELYWVIMVQ